MRMKQILTNFHEDIQKILEEIQKKYRYNYRYMNADETNLGNCSLRNMTAKNHEEIPKQIWKKYKKVSVQGGTQKKGQKRTPCTGMLMTRTHQKVLARGERLDLLILLICQS